MINAAIFGVPFFYLSRWSCRRISGYIYTYILGVYNFIEKVDFEAKPSFPTFEHGRLEQIIFKAVLSSVDERRWVKVKY